MNAYSLHNHTFRCQHAVGDVAELAQAALKGGCRVLGVSDHTPLPDHQWPTVRMGMDELDGYCQAIDQGRIDFPSLRILKGMECEWSKEYQAFYQEELFGKRSFDYLIGAGHFYQIGGEWHSGFTDLSGAKELRAYAEWLTQMMQSGIFAFIAHPDLFGCCNEAWNPDLAACSHDILSAAAATQTPLEINANGFRKAWRAPGGGRSCPYPWEPFGSWRGNIPFRF